MTYGDVRLRVKQSFPSIPQDLIDGWISDRYLSILDRLDWDRMQIQGILQTTAYYETGTVTVTNGLTAITGAGTTWTAAMTGRGIRIANRNEYYEFTRTGDTTGTLNMAYEGDNASGAGYRIFQNIYDLPSDCKILHEIRSFQTGLPLEKMSLADMNTMEAMDIYYGDPEKYALFMDSNASPPLMRVKVWPIPHYSRGLPILYTAEAATLSSTSSTLLPWLRTGALFEGVSADACTHLAKENSGYISLADRHEARFEARVADMIRTEVMNRPSEQIHMARRFIRHRARAWQRYSPAASD